MKKIIKTTVSLLLVVTMLLSFAGCSKTSGAERAVKNLFNAFKALDFEKAQKYIDTGALEIDGAGELLEGGAETFMKKIFGKLEYKIVGAEEKDENTVTVKVSMTSVDMGPVLADFVAKALEYALSNVLSNPSEEEKEKEMEKILDEILSASDLKKTTSEVQLTVVKGEDGWKVASGDTLTDALFGGLSEALDDLQGLFAG